MSVSTLPARFLATAGFCAAMLLPGAALVRGVDFTPPSAEASLAALGSLDDETATDRRLLTPDDAFAPIDAPERGDWLASHQEPGQSYDAFVSDQAQRATEARKVIYLQPLGEFNADSAPSLDALRDYAEAFFQLDVVLLPAEVYESAAFEPRINAGTKKLQLRTTAVLTWLRDRLPDDAFCLVGITMTDLYPDPRWNFVYGQASARMRTGVFSFSRHDPLFFGDDRPDDFDALLLRRSGKTLVHEIAHIFGLAHCIYFRCVENGSNHQVESDSRPHHLCPVCLRKLRFATGADLERRYRDLVYFFSQHTGWELEEAWVRAQLAKLRAEPFTPPVLRDLSAPKFNSPRYIIPPTPSAPENRPAEPVPTSPELLPPPAPAPQPRPDATPPPVPTPVAVNEPLVAILR